MPNQVQELLIFLDKNVVRQNQMSFTDRFIMQSRLIEQIRDICNHTLQNGNSAWVDGADSQCSICHARN